MPTIPTPGEHADKLDAAQLQAIHELRGEPPDDGWQAAGLLASAHRVGSLAPSAPGGPWQPTGDQTLCFFVDLLELGGCVGVPLAQSFLARAAPQELVAMLKHTARAMLAVQQARG